MLTTYVNAPEAVRVATDTVTQIAFRGPAESQRLAARLREDLNTRSWPERRRLAQALGHLRPVGPVGDGVDVVIRAVLSTA